MFVRLGQPANARRRHVRFTNPSQAQAWFEWQRNGRSLPTLVGILLPFELALLFAAGDTPALVGFILLGALLTPPFMATFTAATERRTPSPGGDGYGLTPFMATRPLPSSALVAAKLKMAARSTLAAWLLVLVAIPLALHLSGTSPVVMDRARRIIETIGTPRAVVLGGLLFLALLGSTWKQLVQSLYIGLSGREWIIKSSVFLGLAFFAAVGPIALWLVEQGVVLAVLWDVFPWMLAVLAGLKLCTAAWVAIRLHDRRLLSDRTLVIGVACWLLLVLTLHAVLVWFFATPLFPSYLLLLVAILAIPLARVSAAPLALAWNRHR